MMDRKLMECSTWPAVTEVPMHSYDGPACVHAMHCAGMGVRVCARRCASTSEGTAVPRKPRHGRARPVPAMLDPTAALPKYAKCMKHGLSESMCLRQLYTAT